MQYIGASEPAAILGSIPVCICLFDSGNMMIVSGSLFLDKRWQMIGDVNREPRGYENCQTYLIDFEIIEVNGPYISSSPLSSPETSAFSCPAFIMSCARSCSSVSETAFG